MATSVRMSSGDAAAKWARNIANATPDIQRGIQAVSQAPGAKAASKVDKWFNAVTQAKAKWQRNVGRVTLADWQQAALAGVSRVGSGATQKQGKWAAAFEAFRPHLEAGMRKVDAMPDDTLEQRLARMVEMARHNAGYQRPGGAGSSGG